MDEMIVTAFWIDTVDTWHKDDTISNVFVSIDIFKDNFPIHAIPAFGVYIQYTWST